MTGPAGSGLRLALARACAWSLLIAGWIGIGSLALRLAPSVQTGFALVALWLLVLGGAAARATHGGVQPWQRSLALVSAAGLTGAALWSSVHGGGLDMLLAGVLGWAVLTALASGVVRTLRLSHPVAPAPPVAAAALGAFAAGLVLGDLGDLPALALRLAAFVGTVSVALVLLQRHGDAVRRAPGCRAGLFDCSLPAWPAGAWRDARQWPVLLAGLAMLPMMAALPLMAAWCRADAVAPQAVVLLHLAAMFGPALLLRATPGRWPLLTLSTLCALLLAAGAALVMWAPAPWDLLGLAATHGAAWGLAWSGQLWAPGRRGQQGASPWRAATGYAVLTLAFGVVVEQAGARGVAVVHAALGFGAVLAWFAGLAVAPPRVPATAGPKGRSTDS